MTELSLSSEAKKALLAKLASIGEAAYASRRREIAPPMPSINSLESKLRYLLLWAMINQRTDAKVAGHIALRLYKEFGEALFNDPLHVIKNFDYVIKVFHESGYRVRFAYLTVEAVAALLVLSFLSFMVKLNEQSKQITSEAMKDPRSLMVFLKGETLLAPLGEKALRMYIAFVGHPTIGLTAIRYDRRQLFAFVDGTVGKMFARTGLIEKVKKYRGNQVYAKAMRSEIDKLMQQLCFNDPAMVDIGAWTLGQNSRPDHPSHGCCEDGQWGCESCYDTAHCVIHKGTLGKCPLSDLGCLKRTEWRAYSLRSVMG